MPDVQTIAAPVAPRPDTPADGEFRVLVVDDNEANREVLSRRLLRRSYTVVLAEDGPSALRLVEEQPFDLVILDVMMPGMSGLEVLETLRRTYSPSTLPIIMATAKDQSEDVVRAFSLGASDYVTKPLDFSVVLARVQTQLLLRRSNQQVLELQQRLAQRNTELEGLNTQLGSAYERINNDLKAAAKIQESFLPSNIPDIAGFKFAWVYEPCEHLAGDFLNVCPLDPDHVGMYVLDVSGHGVSAALLAVAAARALSNASDPDSLLVRRVDGRLQPTPPSDIADRLNQKFAWDSNPGQFLTFFYVLIERSTRQLTYVAAGHPAAVVLRESEPPKFLGVSGLPIGIGEKYGQTTVSMQEGDRLYLYSDGVTEAMNTEQELFGNDRLLAALDATRGQPLSQSVASLHEKLRHWQGGGPPRDDISIIAAEWQRGG